MGWRIGDGKNIFIWGDARVPRSNEFKVQNLIVNSSLVIACALWVLWNTRNRFIHEGEVKSGSQMANFVRNYIKELDGLSSSLPVIQFHTSRWVTLMDPWLKINFDAAFNREKKELCSGLVVRDAREKVICSKIDFHDNIPSAFVAEAMACLQVLRLGLHLELRKVDIEGDSRTVICKLQEGAEDRLEIEVVIQDSKYLSLVLNLVVFSLFPKRQTKLLISLQKRVYRKEKQLIC
ncbi:hypothetical protein PVK06_020608 [Gossypium arboreum]|uniref:RNase H type-1 domain-containing protein n=1 Tax=Gossypium arboreum TaxID=29729 RepID=A0ABR0PNB1_GOSAR|nr:hypothetical protein PVK06_020608 [Gossypium arboreum]